MRGEALTPTSAPRSPGRAGGKKYLFTGPSLETALKSIELNFSMIQPGVSSDLNRLKEATYRNIVTFVEHFYSKVLPQLGYKSNEELMDQCKVREKDLRHLAQLVNLTDGEVELLVVTRNKKKIYEPGSIKYVNGKFEVIGVLEGDVVVDIFTMSAEPKWYSCLAKAMMRLIQPAVDAKSCGETDELSVIRQLMLQIISASTIYCMLNPDTQDMVKQEKATLKLLTSPPNAPQPDEESNPYGIRKGNRMSREQFDALFKAVIEDIKEGKKPYVQEICRALIRARNFINSSFSGADYYVSNKASSASFVDFRYRQSILKSCLEGDPWAGHPMDAVIGYQSSYNKEWPKGSSYDLVKTINIWNGSKWKSRTIHYTVNGSQDRCHWIQRRLQRVLSYMRTDCTLEQERGKRFALLITNPRWREEHGWPTVLCYDWSNATDRLSQEFQEEILRLVFPEEVVKFWGDISRCQKRFYFSDGTSKVYTQITGQPQGLLGSFEAFALAHHIIWLMAMKAAGLEGIESTECYRILGDDSIATSTRADRENTLGEAYVQICAYLNLEINRKKSIEIRSDQRTAMADFAKTTVLDGEYFSPIPCNLYFRSGTDGCNYYAFAMMMWMHRHGFNVKPSVKRLIEESYPEEWMRKFVRTIVFGSVSSQWSEFYDPSCICSEWENKIKLAYLVSIVRTTFVQAFLPDRKKEDLSFKYKVKDSIEALLPRDPMEFLDRVECKDHKIWYVLERNLQIEDSIKSILGLSNRGYIAGLVDVTEEEIELIFLLQEVLELVKLGEDPDSISSIRLSLNKAIRNSESFDRYSYRSVYKRDAFEISVLEGGLTAFKELFPEITKSGN